MSPTEAATASDGAAETVGRRALPYARIAIGLAALLGLVWLGREAGGYVPRFAEWVDGLGPWGPTVFVAGYAVAVVGFRTRLPPDTRRGRDLRPPGGNGPGPGRSHAGIDSGLRPLAHRGP